MPDGPALALLPVAAHNPAAVIEAWHRPRCRGAAERDVLQWGDSVARFARIVLERPLQQGAFARRRSRRMGQTRLMFLPLCFAPPLQRRATFKMPYDLA